MKSIIKYICLLGVLVFAGCATPQSVAVSDCAGGDCGSVMLVVHNAKAVQGYAPYSRIEKYVVTVTGQGIEEPLVGEFPGDATEGVIEGVPAGEGRVVEVTAINEDDWTLRAGEEEGIKINGGATADVDVTLEAVPVFTNISRESVVENTRLIFKVYSEEPDPVVIEDLFDAQSDLVVNPSTSAPEIDLDQSTGLGFLAPRVRPIGQHEFTVRSTATGRANTAHVRLLDGALRKAAPFVAGSELGSFSARAGDGIGFVTESNLPLMGAFSGLTLVIE
jgi:hypothetical protein